MAKQFHARKLLELNDEYRSPNEPNPLPWDTVCEEYVKFLEFKRRSTAHTTKQLRTLRLFAQLQNIKTSAQATQKTVQEYMAKYIIRETRFNWPSLIEFKSAIRTPAAGNVPLPLSRRNPIV